MKVIFVAVVLSCIFFVSSANVIECGVSLASATSCVVDIINNRDNLDTNSFCSRCGAPLARYFLNGCPDIQNIGRSTVNEGEAICY